MYPTTQAYKDNIQARTRQILARVIIDYTDPFLDQSITVSTNENANVSYPQQTSDSIEETFGKIASLDGSWVLDGTYVTAPTPQQANTMQMGWWGLQLSDGSGNFTAPYPTLTTEFVSRPVVSLKVVGDTAREEYPVDFVIKLYDEEDAVLHTETVTGNDDVLWDSLIDPVTQVVKMDLTITKWSHPGRQAKIIEFFTSLQETYEGDEILSLSLIEEREVTSGSLPVGNVSSNEIDLQLLNDGRKFDAGNRTSPLYEALKANRRIRAWLGLQLEEDIEWIPLGVFWSGDWNIPEQGITANTSGRDRLNQLRTSTYSNSTVEQNKSLYELAEQILLDAGVDDYEIDDALQSIIIPYAYFTRQSHREALRKIAEACLAQIYCDRLGKIRIEIPDITPVDTVYPTLEVDDDLYLWMDPGAEGYDFVLINGDIHISLPQGVTKDEYFAKSNPIRWSQIANHIEVDTQPLRPAASLEEVFFGEESGGGVYTLFYNHTPCIDAVASVSTGTIISADYFSWGARIEVDVVGDFDLTINARPLRVTSKQKIIRQDDFSIAENGKIGYKFADNPLVQTRTQATAIADQLITYYANPRRDINVDWRGDPSWLLGDRVAVVDDNEINLYTITQQELNWNGALEARIHGRRV